MMMMIITEIIMKVIKIILFSKASKIHLSEAACRALAKFDGYITELRGETFVKVGYKMRFFCLTIFFNQKDKVRKVLVLITVHVKFIDVMSLNIEIKDKNISGINRGLDLRESQTIKNIK